MILFVKIEMLLFQPKNTTSFQLMPRRRILWPTLMVIAKYSSFFAHVYCTLNAVLLFLPLNSYLASFQIQRS